MNHSRSVGTGAVATGVMETVNIRIPRNGRHRDIFQLGAHDEQGHIVTTALQFDVDTCADSSLMSMATYSTLGFGPLEA